MISGSVGRPWAASQVLVARRVRSGRPVNQTTSWSAASSLTSATPSGSGGSWSAAAKNRSHCRGLPSMKCSRWRTSATTPSMSTTASGRGSTAAVCQAAVNLAGSAPPVLRAD
jgi:hypothetical protein